VDLDGIGTVLQIIGVGNALIGQLAGLSHRHKAGLEQISHNGAQNEAACLGADDGIHLLIRNGSGQLVHQLMESFGILEQGGHIAEDDAILRKIGNAANRAHQIHGFYLLCIKR
jgi:hypothetical protein